MCPPFFLDHTKTVLLTPMLVSWSECNVERTTTLRSVMVEILLLLIHDSSIDCMAGNEAQQKETRLGSWAFRDCIGEITTILRISQSRCFWWSCQGSDYMRSKDDIIDKGSLKREAWLHAPISLFVLMGIEFMLWHFHKIDTFFFATGGKYIVLPSIQSSNSPFWEYLQYCSFTHELLQVSFAGW